MTNIQFLGFLTSIFLWSIACLIKKLDSRTRVICLLSGTALLFFSQFFPGLTDGDTITLMNWAKQGWVTDWHAPLLSFIYAYIIEPLYEGPLLIFIGITFTFWFGYYNLVRELIPNSVWRHSVILLLFLYPPNYCIMGQVTKHSVFQACCVFALGMLFVKLPKYLNPMRFISIWLALLLATNTRLESIVVVAPIIALSVSFWTNSWLKVCGFTLLGLITLAMGNAFLNNAIINKYMYPQQGIYDQDLACYSIKENALDYPPDILVKGASFNDFKSSFDYSARDSMIPSTVAYIYNRETIQKLRNLWEKKILNDPTTYLQSRSIIYGCYLGFYAYSDKSGFDFIMSQEQGNRPNSRFDVSSSPITLLFDLAYFKTRVGPVCRPIMVLVLSVFVLFFLMLKKISQKNRRIIISIWLSSLFHIGIYFLVSPGAFFRYAHWPFFAIFLALGLCVAVPPEPHRDLLNTKTPN